MEISEVKKMVRGPLAPVLTVYKEDDLSVDPDAIQENVDQLIRRGMGKGKGVLLAAGAGGDFPLLTYEERKAVIKAVADAADGRAVVLGCAQSPSTAEAIQLAQWSQEVGCYGIQLSGSWYYVPNEDQVYKHLKAVADSIDICVMLYHTPWLGYTMSLELFDRLWEDLDNVRSIKWATSGQAQEINGYLELAEKYAMVTNGPSKLRGALLGASSYVTHLANVWPEHELDFWDLVEAQDYGAVVKEFESVYWPWRSMRDWAGQVVGAGESFAIKPAAELTGFNGGVSRPPMTDLNQEQREHVRSVLETIGAPIVR